MSAVWIVFQLKKFMKKCKVINYTKQLRTTVEKVEETSKVISERRKTAAIDIRDPESVVSSLLLV